MRDDAQRSFRTHDELFQAIAGGVFVQTTAKPHDIAKRCHHFELVDLMPGRTVFYRPVAAGVGGEIAADKAAVAATGITGIKETDRLGGLLHFVRADPGLHGHIHRCRVDLDDLVKTFQRQDDTTAHGNRAAGKTCAGAARHDRKISLVG